MDPPASPRNQLGSPATRLDTGARRSPRDGTRIGRPGPFCDLRPVPASAMIRERCATTRTRCPYCSASLDPLPKAKKRCPSCGQPLWVRSGPDGLTYLLQETDLPVLEGAWQEHHAKLVAEEAFASNLEAARMTLESFRSYAESGVEEVELQGGDDEEACAACRVARRHGRYRLEHAPAIPIVGCTNEICRCSLTPVIDDDKLRADVRAAGLG